MNKENERTACFVGKAIYSLVFVKEDEMQMTTLRDGRRDVVDSRVSLSVITQLYFRSPCGVLSTFLPDYTRQVKAES